MSGSFASVCVILAIFYALFGSIAVLQLVRISVRETSNILSYAWIWPNTIQQQVFIIVALISWFRVAFFFVAIAGWNVSKGEISSDKVAFYSLDEYATVLFFSLTSILALFWAELYYISIQSPLTYTSIIRPTTYFLNVGALIAITFCCIYVSESYPNDVDYVFIQFTITIAIIYLVAALMFAYYARVASSELKDIPVMLSARRERMQLLRMIAMVFIGALLIKAALLIYLTGSIIETSSTFVLVAMFFFYLLLELFPMSTVLAFYQVETTSIGNGYRDNGHGVGNGSGNGGNNNGMDDSYDDLHPSEMQPLDPNNSSPSLSNSSRTWNTFTRTKPTGSDGLDAVIARLSVDP